MVPEPSVKEVMVVPDPYTGAWTIEILHYPFPWDVYEVWAKHDLSGCRFQTATIGGPRGSFREREKKFKRLGDARKDAARCATVCTNSWDDLEWKPMNKF